ncbi:hypothetical protein GCM10010528_24520 [Gordonia defluvii]|jgi:uncharacterized membrane protein YeaQ/YmgE (transglycosylase-associated protein family)|uniref:GlsB/YeaQ/YmgE family stress response membrane protein n=1 Tax=Gordonia defluvii TaxID=283718 RepID=A0ABP6LHY5_9ACTN
MSAAGLIVIGVILFGMIVGGLAQLILGTAKVTTIDWSLAFFSGIAGSFVGGLLHSLITGQGFAIRPIGLIWSLVGAIIVTAGYVWYRKRAVAK